MVRETGAGGAGETPRGTALRKMFGKGRGGGNATGGRGGGGGASAAGSSEKDPPMLQSARVKRELKTIVPPEPCGVDLPEGEVENAMIVHVTTKRSEEVQVNVDDDDVSIKYC